MLLSRFRFSLAAALLAASVLPARAVSIAITNPDFENPVLPPNTDNSRDNFVAAVGEGQTLTAVAGWTFSATQTTSFVSYGGVSDLGSNNHALEGPLDNNIAWLFINGPRPTAGSGTVSARQTLSATLVPETRYMLTARVAQSAHAEGDLAKPNPNFPTLGDGVATGDVFLRLFTGASGSSAMPGYMSALSSVSVPADNTWVNWTLVWQTGAVEPLAGQALTIELFNRGLVSAASLPIEVFFDDVALTALAVPEPSAMLMMALGAGCARRRRRASAARMPISSASRTASADPRTPLRPSSPLE